MTISIGELKPFIIAGQLCIITGGVAAAVVKCGKTFSLFSGISVGQAAVFGVAQAILTFVGGVFLKKTFDFGPSQTKFLVLNLTAAMIQYGASQAGLTAIGLTLGSAVGLTAAIIAAMKIIFVMPDLMKMIKRS